MSSKLKWLANHTAPGSLALQSWLTDNGIGYSLARKYEEAGWLKKLRSGVYYRPDEMDQVKPGWVEALQAATDQLGLPVHLAGLSSLNELGLSHYLQLNQTNVWIGTRSKGVLPKWFREFDDVLWVYCGSHKLNAISDKDFTTVQVNGKSLRASIPELAAYEVVDAIGKQISFEHAAELFQGLVNLRPRKIQSILSRSQAIQTNRVFLFLSHYHGHQWVKRIDESQIALGSGARQVVKDGRYVERFKITVPESLA